MVRRLGPLVVALALAACATPRVSLQQGPRGYTADDYETVYERWTRARNEFRIGDLSSVLDVSATFQSWDFRWSYVVRYAYDFRYSTDARTRMLESSLTDAQRHHRFFVTMAGRYRRETDLTGRGSAWRVLLVNENGGELAPEDIEYVRRPGAAERTYFPTVSPFRLAFRVSFSARDPGTGAPFIRPNDHFFVLRFAGALGAVDLRWDLAPSSLASSD